MLDIKQIESFYPEHLRPFKKNLLREYLQYKILEAIFESPLADNLTFRGGTCVHIVHGNPRFSEDLDFDNPGIGRHDFETLSQRVKRTLELQGYTLELKNTYHEAFCASLRFSGLLRDSGISGHRDEKLLIQVDTEPQKFQYDPDKFILNKFDVFSRINIVPADILVAQKIFCIFNRSRPMGRDFFGVVFLLGKSGVNFEYLDRKMSIRNKKELRDKLLLRSAQLDFSLLAKDLEPFVYSKKELDRVLMFPVAVKLDGVLFATDDGKAVKAARFFNVPFIVTPKIVVELFRLQKISFKKAHKSLEKLGKIGRYSPEIIADALISLMEKEDGKANNH